MVSHVHRSAETTIKRIWRSLPGQSIRTRISIGFGSLTLGLALGISLIAGHVSSKTLRRVNGEAVEELAAQMADKLDRGMFERYRDIQIASTLEPIRDPGASPEARRILLERLQSTYPDYAWIGMADRTGRVVASTGTLLKGKDVAARPWFKAGLNAPFVGDVHDAVLLSRLLPNTTGEPLRFVDVAVPVLSTGGEVLGVLGAHLSWGWAREVEHSLLRTHDAESGIEVFIVDPQGKVLLSPYRKPQDELREVLETARRGPNGFSVVRWADGEEYITGYSQSDGYRNYPGLGWNVLVRQPVHSAMAPARALRGQIMWIGLAVGVAVTILVWWLAGRVMAPLASIAAAADRIRRGDRTVRLPRVHGGDEVALLARSLRVLLGALAHREREWITLNRVLEERVVERTHALVRSEERTRRILEVSHDAFIAIGPDGRIRDWNRQAEQTFGWSAEEVIGEDMESLIVPPELRGAHQAGLRRFLATGESRVLNQRITLPAIRRDGSRFTAEMTITPVPEGGSWVFTAFLHDITDRTRAEQALRENEQRYRGLVESASDMIYRIDARGRFTYVNPMMARTVGIPSAALIGMHFRELVRGESAELVQTFYRRQWEELTPVTYLEFSAHTASGRELWLGQNLQLLFEGERVVGAQGVARDITARRETEQLKDEFISVVSHELRTPLTSIRGSLGLLASGVLDARPERKQRMLEIASHSTDRLVRLINDILDIERITSGKTTLVKQETELVSLLEQAAADVRGAADAARIRIEVEDGHIPLVADPDRVVQVVVNLLGNAVKFSPAGSSVHVRAAEHDGEVRVEVRDEGRGIPEDKIEHVFGRFQQVDASDAREKGGTGLGLAICSAIVQQHGGEIGVESKLGAGSTFWFTLPTHVGAVLQPA